MKIFEVIDYLFVGIRYGSWGIGLLGIVASIVLAIANVGMGFSAVILFVATLLLSIAISLLLAPQKWMAKKLSNKKKYTISAVCLIGAVLIAGITFLTNSGFPELNLLFI